MAAALVVLKKAAIVDLNKGNLDKAVEKLQKLVRISVASGSTDVISTVPLWLLLGEAYVSIFGPFNSLNYLLFRSKKEIIRLQFEFFEMFSTSNQMCLRVYK